MEHESEASPPTRGHPWWRSARWSQWWWSRGSRAQAGRPTSAGFVVQTCLPLYLWARHFTYCHDWMFGGGWTGCLTVSLNPAGQNFFKEMSKFFPLNKKRYFHDVRCTRWNSRRNPSRLAAFAKNKFACWKISRVLLHPIAMQNIYLNQADHVATYTTTSKAYTIYQQHYIRGETKHYEGAKTFLGYLTLLWFSFFSTQSVGRFRRDTTFKWTGRQHLLSFLPVRKNLCRMSSFIKLGQV